MFSFFPNSSVCGIEISSTRLTVASLSGKTKIRAVNEMRLEKNVLLKNGLRDKDNFGKQLNKLLKEAEPHAITGGRAVCSVPESAVFSKVIKLPKLSGKELRQTIPYEAAEFLPLPLEEIYLDWQIQPTTTDEEKPSIHVFVVAAPKRLVDDISAALSETDLDLISVESQPFAIRRSVSHRLSPSHLSLILDIDASVTTLILTTSRNIKFTSTLLVGTTKLQQDLHANLTLIADEITESIKYYHNRLGEAQSIKSILLTGSGATLPHVSKELEQLTKLSCSVGYLPFNLPDGSAINPRFNTVMGLSLWGKV